MYEALAQEGGTKLSFQKLLRFAALFEHQKKIFTTLPPVVNRKLMWRSVITTTTTTTITNCDDHAKPGIWALRIKTHV